MPDAISETSEAVVVMPPTIVTAFEMILGMLDTMLVMPETTVEASKTIFGIPKIVSDKRYPGVERPILAVWPRESGGVWKWGRA
ncbi:MAG: hypothetical protein HRU13_11010 [Phycisphaerales bacterium]|nr:hypothetical protein [Phycisphaerales bacterium]